jgi:murein DD-endopeptidase MepM/ murein hydrolase activator NlpD
VRSSQVGCLAACAIAALAVSGTGRAAADPTAPVCVGTGLLATEAPGAGVPDAVGPVLLGPDRAGTSVDNAGEPAADLSIASVSLGVAGCLDAKGTPGGSTLRAGAWSILGGAIGGTSLRADLVPRPGSGNGWWLRAAVEGLVVEGRQVTLGPGDEVDVGDWGTLSTRPALAPLPAGAPLRWWRAALQLELTRAHGGFAAGTTFLIGWVGADRVPLATAAVEPPAPTTTPHAATGAGTAKPTTKPPTTTATTTTTTTTKTAAKPRAASPSSSSTRKRPAAKHETGTHPAAKHKAAKSTAKHTAPLTGQPLSVTPSLGAGARTFPVVGDVAWGDTYGASRSDVPGGWHHGDDLFAPLGTPVVAVANGVVFAVGWNRVGGWRLWLVDAQGNQYYYAHLSGYSALARNNHHVRRGQVLGFVGNTGDAVTTWPHVHFEVHPNGLLYLGYDGAVDPTRYLAAWTRLGRIASVPPPVPLPSGAPSGEGAVRDFRALLAIRPMKASPQVAASAKIRSRQRPPRAAAGATVAASLRIVPARRSRDGESAILAGLALLAGALVALHFTWRAGRT